MKIGDRITLTRGAIADFPVMTILEIDEGAGKARIRFSRPPGSQGYSYVFWRDLADIQEFVNTVHNLTLDTITHTIGEVTRDGRTSSEV
jgi:hypothetical protein